MQTFFGKVFLGCTATKEDQNKGILGKRPDINTCWRAYQGEHKNPGKPEENFDWDVR